MIQFYIKLHGSIIQKAPLQAVSTRKYNEFITFNHVKQICVFIKKLNSQVFPMVEVDNCVQRWGVKFKRGQKKKYSSTGQKH